MARSSFASHASYGNEDQDVSQEQRHFLLQNQTQIKGLNTGFDELSGPNITITRSDPSEQLVCYGSVRIT